MQRVLLDHAMRQLAQVSIRVVCKSLHLAEERFCSWLLTLHDHVETGRIRLTHEQISAFVGVNRSSISVTAKKLKEEGLIDYRRGRFQIIDRHGLAGLACECYKAAKPF